MTGLVIPDGGTIGSKSDTDAISVASDGKVTLSQPVGGTLTLSGDFVPATPLSHRNIVINGAMQVAQRGTSFTGYGASVNWSLDRFFTYHNSDGAFTISQESSVVPTGFKNSLKILITTADASLTSSQRLIVGTRFEGNTVSHLNFGTANAESITLSFYVRSSITGTHGAVLGNGSDNRAYPFTYIISSADTWERKSITIPGDQTGTWVTNNTKGMQIVWGLGVGTSFSASAGAWGAGDISSATGATTAVLGTENSTWYLSGVQLELGTVATPFEHRSYGDELARCQRYYQITDTGGYHYTWANEWSGVGNSRAHHRFPVVMRSAPTFSYKSGADYNHTPTRRMNDWGIIVEATDASSTTGVWQVSAEL